MPELTPQHPPGSQGDFSEPAFQLVAVLYPHSDGAAPRWHNHAAALARATALQAGGQMLCTFLPIDYGAADAANQVRQAFARIDQQVRLGLCDSVLLLGGAEVEPAIDVIYQAIVPGIAGASVPVLTALGADDRQTILGDTAWRTFDSPALLLDFIAQRSNISAAGAHDLLQQVRALAGFLLAGHTVDSRILLQSALRPGLHRHLKRATDDLDRLRQALRRTAEPIRLRLIREEAALEQTRANIGIQVARLAQAGERRRQGAVSQVRIGMLALLVATGAALWFSGMAPATAVFIGGCIMVCLSALYVGLINRILDR